MVYRLCTDMVYGLCADMVYNLCTNMVYNFASRQFYTVRYPASNIEQGTVFEPSPWFCRYSYFLIFLRHLWSCVGFAVCAAPGVFVRAKLTKFPEKRAMVATQSGSFKAGKSRLYYRAKQTMLPRKAGRATAQSGSYSRKSGPCCYVKLAVQGVPCCHAKRAVQGVPHYRAKRTMLPRLPREAEHAAGEIRAPDAVPGHGQLAEHRRADRITVHRAIFRKSRL